MNRTILKTISQTPCSYRGNLDAHVPLTLILSPGGRREGDGRVTHSAQTHRAGVLRPLLMRALILAAIVATAMAQPLGAVDVLSLMINTNCISSPQFPYTCADQIEAP